MNAWKEYADKLAEKLMDAGNIVFAALIIGQFVGDKPFDWGSAVISGAAWLGLYAVAYVVVYLGRRE